jgi:hypothetical protein
MRSVRLPMSPVLQDVLILFGAALVSSLLCIKVFG